MVLREKKQVSHFKIFFVVFEKGKIRTQQRKDKNMIWLIFMKEKKEKIFVFKKKIDNKS